MSPCRRNVGVKHSRDWSKIIRTANSFGNFISKDTNWIYLSTKKTLNLSSTKTNIGSMNMYFCNKTAPFLKKYIKKGLKTYSGWSFESRADWLVQNVCGTSFKRITKSSFVVKLIGHNFLVDIKWEPLFTILEIFWEVNHGKHHKQSKKGRERASKIEAHERTRVCVWCYRGNAAINRKRKKANGELSTAKRAG